MNTPLLSFDLCILVMGSWVMSPCDHTGCLRVSWDRCMSPDWHRERETGQWHGYTGTSHSELLLGSHWSTINKQNTNKDILMSIFLWHCGLSSILGSWVATVIKILSKHDNKDKDIYFTTWCSFPFISKHVAKTLKEDEKCKVLA